MCLNEKETSNTGVNFCLLAFYYLASSEPDLLLKSKLSSFAALHTRLQTKRQSDHGVSQLLFKVPQAYPDICLPECYAISQILSYRTLCTYTDTVSQCTDNSIQCVVLNVLRLLETDKPESESLSLSAHELLHFAHIFFVLLTILSSITKLSCHKVRPGDHSISI